jgi:hypothetical protein
VPVAAGELLVAVGVDEGVGVAVVRVGVGVAVVGVVTGVEATAVGLVAEGVGVELADGWGSQRGAQVYAIPLLLPPAVLPVSVVMPTAAASATPDVAVSRTLPATRATAAGRACVKRMKRPTSAAHYCYGTTHSVWSGCITGETPTHRDSCTYDASEPQRDDMVLIPGVP